MGYKFAEIKNVEEAEGWIANTEKIDIYDQGFVDGMDSTITAFKAAIAALGTAPITRTFMIILFENADKYLKEGPWNK